MFNSIEDVLAVVLADGVPRYGVCNSDTLRKICAPHESVRDGAGLYLRPDPCNPWYYMNSTAGVTDGAPTAEQNVRLELVFSGRGVVFSDKPFQILENSSNGLNFRIKHAVSKGTELLIDYPIRSVASNLSPRSENVDATHESRGVRGDGVHGVLSSAAGASTSST